MKEFVEKLIGRLEEIYDRNDKAKKEAYEEQDWERFDLFTHRNDGIYSAISIVNQLAEEYKTKREKVVSELLKGEWVDTKEVEVYLGIDFKLGLKLFDFSRTAEWNPPPLNGQKITTKFRLKNNTEVKGSDV